MPSDSHLSLVTPVSASGKQKRIPKESPEAAAAKLEYAQMGRGRTLRKFIEQRKQSGNSGSHRHATIGQWSSWYNWQAFVKHYDAEQATERQRKATEAIELLNETQSKIAQDASLRIFKRLSDILAIDEAAIIRLRKAATGEQPFEKGEHIPHLIFTPHVLVEYFRATTELARTSLGAATEIVQQQMLGKDGGPIEVSDAREQLAARLASLAERHRTAQAIRDTQR